MRKRAKGRKFHRKTDQRRAFLKALSTSLFLKEKIKTTEARAKETSMVAEKAITRAKKGDIAARRLLASTYTPKVVKKLMEELGPRYADRKGGYTRIVKLGARSSDGSKMALYR